MHVAAREDFAEQMAYLFADAQHPDRRSLVLFGCLHFAFSSSSSFATMRAIERMLRAVPLQPKRLSMKGDRKSVVEGKSVAVRVDLGGRRIIKKKNEYQL